MGTRGTRGHESFSDYEKDKLQRHWSQKLPQLKIMEGMTKELQSGLDQMKSTVAEKDQQTKTDC
jgi:hypothetical protein